MIAGFETNEILKERLVEAFGAKYAISRYIKMDAPFIPHEYLETIVFWDKDTNSSLLGNSLQLILLAKRDIEEECNMSTPHLEILKDQTPKITWNLYSKNV